MTLTSSSAYSTSTLTDFYSLPELMTFTRPLLILIFLLVVVKFFVRLRVSTYNKRIWWWWYQCLPGGVLPPRTIANALNVFCDVELVLVSIGLIGLVSRPSPRMLLMFSFAEFYAMEIICYTHCYPTRTVMVTIYVTGRHDRTLASNHNQRNFIDRQLHKHSY